MICLMIQDMILNVHKLLILQYIMYIDFITTSALNSRLKFCVTYFFKPFSSLIIRKYNFPTFPTIFLSIFLANRSKFCSSTQVSQEIRKVTKCFSQINKKVTNCKRQKCYSFVSLCNVMFFLYFSKMKIDSVITFLANYLVFTFNLKSIIFINK